MAKFTHTFWPHYWGISEDDSLMRNGQVIYAENMDITSNSKFINLTRKTASYLTWLPNEVVSMFYDNKVWFLSCDQDRNLYKNNNLTPVWTVERVVGYWVAQDYLYMIDTSEDIHRILISDTSNANWSTFITTTETGLPVSSVGHFKIIALEDITYIWYDTWLYVINNATGTIDITATYNFLSADLVWMTILGNVIKLYQEDWKLLLWKWIWAVAVTEIIDLWIPINFIHQVANIDYVVSAWRIYMLQWYTLTNIIYSYYSDKLNSNKIEIDRGTIFDSGLLMAFLNWVFYVAGNSSNLNLWDWVKSYGWDSVLTYWKKKNQLPNALNVFNTYASTWQKYTKIYWIYKSQGSASFNDVVYVAYEDALWSFWIDTLTPSDWDYYPNRDIDWIIVYENFDSWMSHLYKKEAEVIIRADLQIDDTIELFYIDSEKVSDDNMIPILTINWPWELFKRTINTQFLDKTFALRFRQDWNLKKNKALKYYNLTINYETIEDQGS